MFASDSARVDPLVPREPLRPGAGAIDDALLLSVGSTPLVPLARLSRSVGGGFELWAKLEARNPSGSVKDRAALSIVQAALADGTLGTGRTLVDASSGNTGVAYAWLGARLGFRVRLYLPRTVRAAHLAEIRAFGAEVVLTDPGEGTDGAQREAKAYAEAAPSSRFFADQYNNPANPRAHYVGTGPELWAQTGGRVTHLVAGVGTGGTISGTGRYLRERRPDVRIVGVEPTGPIHGLEGLKHLPTAVVPSTYDPRILDRTVRIETEEAEGMVARLAREEGLRAGRSAAAVVVAALRVGAEAPGAVVVAVLADAGSPAPAEEGP